MVTITYKTNLLRLSVDGCEYRLWLDDEGNVNYTKTDDGGVSLKRTIVDHDDIVYTFSWLVHRSRNCFVVVRAWYETAMLCNSRSRSNRGG